jgi:hypothetical protein
MNRVLITQKLASIGGHKLTDDVFELPSECAEIRWLLFLTVRTGAETRISADIGVRCDASHQFSVAMLKKYGDASFEKWRVNNLSSCIRFSLGDWAKWQPGASLWQQNKTDDQFALEFTQAIGQFILPTVARVNSLAAYLQYLLTDEEPCEWVKTNGALRAAECIFLAAHCNKKESIDKMLIPFESEIGIGLGAKPKVNAVEFVKSTMLAASLTRS